MFIVDCKRDGRKDKFILSFQYEPSLISKLKEIHWEDRKFNSSNKTWTVKTFSLYNLMLQYKGNPNIFFKFDDVEKEYFKNKVKKKINEIKTLKERQEKLEEKKIYWLEYKKQLEETYKVHEDKLHQNLKEGVQLLPFQSQAVLFGDVVRNVLFALEMGTGKAQPLDSKLLTPDGWVLMGDIKVGDYVIGSDGKPKQVLGVFDQGEKDIYNITFNDGTNVECCDEHLWNVNTPIRNWRNQPFLTMSTKDIIEGGYKKRNGDNKYYIPIVKPIEFEKKEYIIHPYNLGCILGDGCVSSKCSVQLTNIDEELLNIFENNLIDEHYLKKKGIEYLVQSNLKRNNKYSREIERLGLRGKKSDDKFIPKEYLFGSIEDRLELLQGLMDTDGYAGKSMNEITLKSKQLIEDLRFLVESLGGIGRLNDKFIYYNGKKIKYYRLLVKLPLGMHPFKIKRKRGVYKPPIKYKPNRGIKNIEFVGRKEARCIMVDSEDSLYVTNNCILTHNTLISIALSEYNNFNKIFVITPNSLKFNYFYEVEKFTNSKAHIINWKKNKYTFEESKYIIINYDFFRNNNSVKKFEKLNLGKIECLILDECHRIKNTKSNIYKNFKAIFTDDIFVNKTPCKIFMSGTPMNNRAYELYTVMNQISPIDFPNKQIFYSEYCGMTYDPSQFGGYNFDSNATNFEGLYHKISPYVFRVRKMDVLKDLPSKTYERIILELTTSEEKEYNNILDGIIDELTNKETISNPMTIMLRLRQYLSILKVNNNDLIEFIDMVLEMGEKIVIMDYFKEGIEILHEKYKDISVLHYGDVSVEDRSEMVKQFQDKNSNIKMFLSTVQTGKEGLTLTSSSKIMVLTQPYTVSENDQVVDRVHRISQTEKVNVYYPLFNNTIDFKVFNLVEDKKKEIVKVLDNEEYKTKMDDSTINELVNSLKLINN